MAHTLQTTFSDAYSGVETIWCKFHRSMFSRVQLAHWGHVMHLCICNLAVIGSDNGLSPSRCQTMIWTNAGILIRNKLQWNANRNSNFFIEENAFQYVIWKMLAIFSRPQCVNNKSPLPQVITWCHQATSCSLNWWWINDEDLWHNQSSHEGFETCQTEFSLTGFNHYLQRTICWNRRGFCPSLNLDQHLMWRLGLMASPGHKELRSSCLFQRRCMKIVSCCPS